MSNQYRAYHFKIVPKQPATEILIAELANAGFESFSETEMGVSAYIQAKYDNEDLLATIYVLQNQEFDISYTSENIAPINWNQQWEDNFKPLIIENTVSIRAPFHQDQGLPYEIVIEPKMSFGTGHHETTYMMVQQLLGLELKGKKVLDMGCGTGILAIFAEMKGAQPIDAIDIDAWCYENSLENCDRNLCNNISVYQGDASLLKAQKYDVIIANINRNILLDDLNVYANCLTTHGTLLLSGFYTKDIPLIDREANTHHLKLEHTLERNNWVALRYIKK